MGHSWLTSWIKKIKMAYFQKILLLYLHKHHFKWLAGYSYDRVNSP